MCGELSFCINDLASCRGDLKEVARLVWGNYRGATSAEGSIRKIIAWQVLATACGFLDHVIALAFKGAGSDVVVLCQPQTLPSTCASHLTHADELARSRMLLAQLPTCRLS
jgi:hypothetical protein